jgi:hypothetical protein
MMGYTLKIGEAAISYNADYCTIDCDIVSRDDAPAFGEPTDHENRRWPSYSVWSNAMETLGLMSVMFGAGEFTFNGVCRYPLIAEHPGVTPITKEHVECVESVLVDYKAAHPDRIAKYPPPKEGAEPVVGDMYREEDLIDDPRYDSALCRGEWLAYWLRWALDNCKQPVFVNS